MGRSNRCDDGRIPQTCRTQHDHRWHYLCWADIVDRRIRELPDLTRHRDRNTRYIGLASGSSGIRLNESHGISSGIFDNITVLSVGCDVLELSSNWMLRWTKWIVVLSLATPAIASKTMDFPTKSAHLHVIPDKRNCICTETKMHHRITPKMMSYAATLYNVFV